MLDGELNVPPGATGVVLFAHGSGSSRHSPGNQYVAQVIRDAGIGTLLFDLLTPEEEAAELRSAHLRFDIGLLAGRLVDATRWIAGEPDTRLFRLGARETLGHDSVREVWVTDTVPVKERDWPLLRVVSVAPLIAAALRQFAADGSLRDLF